ncbi:helix-turn-helix transcriptional regulator [Verrucomicrobiales bacterium BCK34]|nr:helix-turn-helix transcriptional regulator [Verrucomicrobiales bacterium BCK34]
MNDSTGLMESDVRAMVRLLGEIAALNGGHEERKRALMDGLCDLIGADYWVWGLMTKFESGEPPVYTAMATGGFDADQFPKLLVAYEHPDLGHLTGPLADEIAKTGTQITRRREDFDPHDIFPQSGASALFLNANVDVPLLTLRPIQNGCVSGIGFYRKFGAERFTLREAQIAHIILSEVHWLHEQGWPWSSAKQLPSLPLRCRLVLNLLLEGLSRKQVADQMEISVHTVSGYVKQVYEYFRVNSHAELITKFRCGDGGHSRAVESAGL